MSAGRFLFVSDVHSTAAAPLTRDAFLRFASGPARGADALFVLGDLFETFVAPAEARRPGTREVVDALAELRRAGTRVAFLPGNRDFPLEGVLRPLGIERLPDTARLEVGGARVVATHGDLLCTADRRYQAFRRAIRGRPLRTVVQSLPPALLEGLAARARDASKAETARKAWGTMGLDAGRVRRILMREDADALVCGHVHWGVRHRMSVEGRERDVFVLGAWEDGANWLERSGGEWRFVREGGP
ncbi:MAG TPA: UDP-2,3-diacylglucosamine diphosphatase [Planctomycetota bacterium]|nr:UDP-2,3-diacylglucosamine diphosphatase [Planctomycetota bacterium]